MRDSGKLTELDRQEKNRQKHFINLIPSENFTSQAVLDALGSVMQSMSCAPSHTTKTDKLAQTSTRRDTQAQDTTAATSTLTRQSGYVRKERSRRSV
jgi:hypothetical protein